MKNPLLVWHEGCCRHAENATTRLPLAAAGNIEEQVTPAMT
ncbi:hypothetical protein [Xanthomonas vesicatoria]|nr:hypothetical protein [Xanthomonas vesicatoria]